MVSLLLLSPVPLAVLPAVSSALIEAVIGPSARPEQVDRGRPLPSPLTTTWGRIAVGERHRRGGVGIDAGDRVARPWPARLR